MCLTFFKKCRYTLELEHFLLEFNSHIKVLDVYAFIKMIHWVQLGILVPAYLGMSRLRLFRLRVYQRALIGVFG